jgi:hypothetical protein
MGFRCGIVGLPNVGKSTLFNALTETAAAQAANYPFCTIEPNVGGSPCPIPAAGDRQIAKSANIIETQLEFVDIAGPGPRASKGEGLGNQFLANIREVDAIVHVLRCFEGGDVTHVEGRVDPVADAETVETELMLADLDSLEKRVPNLAKKARRATRRPRCRPPSLARRWNCCGIQAARLTQPKDEEERIALERAQLLTAKPSSTSAMSMRAMRRGQCPQRARVREGGGGRRQGGDHLGRDRGRDRHHAAEDRAEFLSDLGLEETGPQPHHPRRLRASRPHHLLHRGPQGIARLDGRERAQRPRRPQARSTRFRARLHPRRDHRL